MADSLLFHLFHLFPESFSCLSSFKMTIRIPFQRCPYLPYWRAHFWVSTLSPGHVQLQILGTLPEARTRYLASTAHRCAWRPTRAQLLWPSHSTRSFFHGSLPLRSLSSHHDMIWGCSLTRPAPETKNATVPTWQSCRTASGISMHFLDVVFFGRISYISFESETESAVLRCVIRWSRVQFCWEGNSQPLGHHLGQRGRKGSTTREASLDARMPPSQDSCRAPVQMIATRPCQHPSSDKPTYRRV